MVDSLVNNCYSSKLPAVHYVPPCCYNYNGNITLPHKLTKLFWLSMQKLHIIHLKAQ